MSAPGLKRVRQGRKVPVNLYDADTDRIIGQCQTPEDAAAIVAAFEVAHGCDAMVAELERLRGRFRVPFSHCPDAGADCSERSHWHLQA